MSQPRVRGESARAEDRVHFSPSMLPPYLRRSQNIDEFLLERGFHRRLQRRFTCLVGEEAAGLSATAVVRLKEKWSAQYDAWCRRDLAEKHYVYVLGGRYSRERATGG